jgi:hypothetical protein
MSIENPSNHNSSFGEPDREKELDQLMYDLVQKIQDALTEQARGDRRGNRTFFVDGKYYTGVAEYLIASHTLSLIGEDRFNSVYDLFCPESQADGKDGEPYTDSQMAAAGDDTLRD